MKYFLIILIFSLSTLFSLHATHLCGGDMRVEQAGANQFIVFARYFSQNGYSNNTVKIFDNSSNNLILSVTVSLDSSRSIKYSAPSTDTINIHYYSSDTITLANNPNGYYAVLNHGFTRTYITNVSSPGKLLFYCQIPNPAIAGRNSNPKFIKYEDSLSYCIGNLKSINFSCSDPDGDILVYSLVEPLGFTTVTGGKPFTPMIWSTGHNLSNILGPGSTCTINSNTGIVTTRSVSLGRYIIGVKCEEYRGGIKIGETIRDVPIPSLNCLGSSHLKENKLNSINIFPNPSNGKFIIDCRDLDQVKAEIFNSLGQNILTKQISTTNNNIDLSQLQRGVYFVKLYSGKQSSVKKIIIE